MADPEDAESSSFGGADTLPAASDTLPAESSGALPARSPFPVSGWDRYEMLAVLGEGGMGTVYLAVDRRLGRDVALKFIRGGDPSLTMRLLQEARAQAKIDHPGVCKVFEVGEVQGKAYIAMELVRGRPLDEAAAGMSLHQKVQAVRDVARALHEAHVLGIVHRDVKPSNILVETREDGALRPVVMDFGIARDEDAGRLTESGALVGTPAYMSPEQARGDRQGLDRRSDVYSLGATLYELLAGVPVFSGGNAMMLVHAVLTEEPAPLRARVRSLPEDLETIVAKCLRKEPGQRYDSARALAEDLDLYIRGEPIVGRRESLVARLRRRAKKNRAVVLMAALAVVALFASGGLAVRARMVAHRHAAELAVQAELGRELGQEANEMESFMRSARLLPLHDLTRERVVVKERMKRLDARAVAGPAAAALVDYAVGRGHLALDEDAEAAERLERAERGGLDTPELHYALGLARGRLYHRALLDAKRLPDERAVGRRLREIEDEFLRPALASMEKSREAREAPSYLPALMAFYRKDYDGALRMAQKAHEGVPWLYEALALQADVLLARGIERKDRGERDDAAQDLEEAARLYDAAAQAGRSDARLYEGSAEAWVRRMELALGRASPEDSLARALDRCEEAAVARPDTGAPYTEMAYALGFIAQHLLGSGADPRPILTRMLAALDRARALGGDEFVIYERRAAALIWRGQYEELHGFDPSASFDEAVTEARHVVDVAPMHPWSHVALGNANANRAWVAAGTGGDPEPELRAAIDSFRRAYTLDEGYAYAYAHALGAHGSLTLWRAHRGQDPSEVTAQAADVFAGCIRANASEGTCYTNMGQVDRGLSEYQILAGQDAREALAHAVEHFEKARALMPVWFPANSGGKLARVHLLRAADAIRRGEDPAPALESLSQVLAEGYRADPKDQDYTFLDARRALLLADLDARARRPERAALESAHALAALAVERDPRDADAHQVLAEAERRLAALVAPPPEQAKHRAEGLDACARGLAVNPNHPRLLATKGGLLLLEARAADPTAKAESARKALEALRRAVELNPLLRREVGPLLDEAERLSG